jgi:MFS transporter, UMF1 family
MTIAPPVTGQATDVEYSRKEQIGWYFYDWANSAFSTTVVTVFMGPYITSIAEAAADAEGFIYPLGIPVFAGSYYAYLISLSVLLQVFFLPILGALADYSQRKKQFFAITAYIGAFAATGLYFLEGTNFLFGGGLFVLANLSFGASIVFYNAFLPDISSSEDRDRVSSQGWALGYFGGGLLLALNLVFVQFLAEPMGFTVGQAVRISLASAGIWWGLFTIVPLITIKRRQPLRRLPSGERVLTVGFRQLRHTLRQLPNFPHTMLFLVAYLLYNDGIQTVIALSAVFGSQELGMETTSLVQLILMVQFVAFFGALGFERLARVVGTKRAIMISLVIWLGVTVYAWGFLQNETQFFVLGAVIALVLGGSQALSRSVFSLMIPRGQEAEYFSLYEISERGTSWLGPYAFGLTLQLTGSYRLALLSIAIFFAAGLILLAKVNVQRAVAEAGNEVPAHL